MNVHFCKRSIRIGSKIIRLFNSVAHFCATTISALQLCNEAQRTYSIIIVVAVPSINSEQYYFLLLFPFYSVYTQNVRAMENKKFHVMIFVIRYSSSGAQPCIKYIDVWIHMNLTFLIPVN